MAEEGRASVDALGYVNELRILMNEDSNGPTTGADPSPDLAYDVHRYHGYCQLYGIDVPDDVKDWFKARRMSFFGPAEDDLLRVLKHTIALARRLQKAFDESDEPEENMDCCTSILHLLMSTWATFVSLDLSFRDYVKKTGYDGIDFDRQFDKIMDTFHELDSALEDDELKILSVATSTHLLDNWRSMLVGHYRELPPWWLDGRLESISRAIDDEIAG